MWQCKALAQCRQLLKRHAVSKGRNRGTGEHKSRQPKQMKKSNTTLTLACSVTVEVLRENLVKNTNQFFDVFLGQATIAHRLNALTTNGCSSSRHSLNKLLHSTGALQCSDMLDYSQKGYLQCEKLKRFSFRDSAKTRITSRNQPTKQQLQAVVAIVLVVVVAVTDTLEMLGFTILILHNAVLSSPMLITLFPRACSTSVNL